MNSRNVLTISSSRAGNSGYLEKAAPMIQQFLGDSPLQIAFIPFAAVDNNYNSYLETVKGGLQNLPYEINVVTPFNAKKMIEECDAVMVGGGNTFKLLHDLYKYELIEPIQSKVAAGAPYIGWSAGANIAGLTICTTNDMPIVEPKSFNALEFLPFQINPHYFNVAIDGHHGETRDDRLNEYLVVNPYIPIVALPEGTALQLKRHQLTYLGDKKGVLFHCNHAKDPVQTPIEINQNLNNLLESFSLSR